MDSDAVFFRQGNELKGMPARSFAEGIGEERLEAALQQLIAESPQLIPGGQISPEDEDAPRFALLATESSLAGRFAVDHVMVDHHGLPTLLETKLFQNPESRRDVVGQILEYAAIAVTEWRGGELRGRAERYWQSKNRAVADVLQEQFDADPEDIETLWAAVESNLEKGAIRLLVVGDRIRPEVRRILEFLNREMRNVEVYGLELQCYGDGKNETIIVPRIVGQTQQAADRRKKEKGGTPVRPWSLDDLRYHYRELSETAPKLAAVLQDTLEWASQRNTLALSTSATPCFAIQSPSGSRILTVNPDGILHWYARPENYPDASVEVRNRFLDGPTQLKLADDRHSPQNVVSSKNLLRRLDQLTAAERESLKALVLSLSAVGD